MKKTTLIYFALTLFIGSLFSFDLAAQDENVASNYKMSFKFMTIKQEDNTRLLDVEFKGKNKEDRKDILPIYDADIYFYNVLGDEKIELGKVKTDNQGIASLVLAQDYKYLKDENGFINLLAEFKGSDAIKSMKKELAVKDIILNLDFKEVDSVKTVFLTAYTLDSLNNKVPVEEVDIIFSVEGLISKMPIHDETLENGKYNFEFPKNIRGDKNGIVTVYALIDDSDDFGYVTTMKEVNWGTFRDVPISDKNALWSQAAPIWMYVVLSILLLGVWANYVYTVINLFSIKKEGKLIEEA